ncbi:hypothetical protein AF335_25225 [Streptomyces eurocidicus]|uniref:Uncharacterized protein n=1 Tax=Streptomyces eurocidicus TaxID=66423 RepID=A0A2N8NRD7_STREU|nr:hypothetical protein AF335_25225 [Streptomyces eurocidicus]
MASVARTDASNVCGSHYDLPHSSSVTDGRGECDVVQPAAAHRAGRAQGARAHRLPGGRRPRGRPGRALADAVHAARPPDVLLGRLDGGGGPVPGRRRRARRRGERPHPGAAARPLRRQLAGRPRRGGVRAADRGAARHGPERRRGAAGVGRRAVRGR